MSLPGVLAGAAAAVVIWASGPSPGGVTELFIMPGGGVDAVLDVACTFSRHRLHHRGVY